MSGQQRVLIVGVGSIGERHLRCFGATGRCHLSFCEVNPALRETIAARYSVQDVYDNFEAALASQPDVVVIATPAHLHISMAAAAVEAGAQVLIEKPLSTTLAGVDALFELIGQRQATVGVAYVYRAHPILASMREAIRSGRFGTPLQIVAMCGQHFPFYRPAYRDTYYKDRSTGGGAVQDALTHVINAGEWLVGPVGRLVADIDHLALDGVTVEDTVHVLARHGAVMGCYSLNQHQAPNETSITVICSGGTARFELHQCRWLWQTEPGGDWTVEESATLERDTLFIRQAAAFLDAVEHQTAPACDVAAARQTLRVNLAILRSAESGAWEQVATPFEENPSR